MPSQLDSRSLALFLAVADALSFRQAAEVLHLSQPPLSRAIRELEARLGTSLFDRHARGVSLTAAGRRLLPYARGVADLLRQAEAAFQGAAVPSTLRLGLTSAAEPAWFRGLADRAQALQPGVRVEVASDTSPRLVRQLRAGRLDAAFIALPTDVRGLEVLELDRLPMLVAMPSTHPLARRRLVRLADLAQEPVFWFERARQPAFHDHCQRVFDRYRFAPPRLREPADHHVLLADVAAGRGIALLAASFAGLRRAGVVYRRLAEGDALALGIGLATPPGQPALRTLLARASGVPRAPSAGN
ncbi:LysR family transcriptional regulator [Paracidovorax cattleyae]|uniref:DNA-binding transcriptional regulator, LysR family n=1 Tax=Paracidovorax cattleyae TaxID=80868 RepID=A0A1H0WS20_9BURK|nr:LysR family transcriptional regulator [Paracidovorax cattleyae]AVS72727.1 LysR family transcriptional regulator [Paracidovorax cattleyae]SDP93463.1 DNA-binding transcriptional regulator, LysR family [Paracidovorax cattleyae]